MSPPVTIAVEPIDDVRCRFIVSRRLHAGGALRFRTAAEAKDVPVAQAVLGIAGIIGVEVENNVLTLFKQGGASWRALEDRIRYAISATLAAGEHPRPAPSAVAVLDDDALYDAVGRILATVINPEVARHGGRVELVDVQDATAVVRMQGGCQGCGMASVTLQQGVEATLKQMLPGLAGISDVTDHAAGTSPFFAAAKK